MVENRNKSETAQRVAWGRRFLAATVVVGLIGEIIIFTHARNVREYKIAEVIRTPSRPELVAPGEAPAMDGARQAS